MTGPPEARLQAVGSARAPQPRDEPLLQHNGGVPTDGLQRIIVVPRNGYANRLQAWASATALGQRLGVPVELLWAPQAIAPAPAELLFDSQLVDQLGVELDEVTALIGTTDLDEPTYLTRVPSTDTLILSGDDRGEQAFMAELLSELARPPAPRVLVLIAGGHFHLAGTRDPAADRRAFYRALPWSQQVTELVEDATAQHPGPYIALHLRGTDRSVTAPRSSAVHRAVRTLAERTGIEQLFIAADTSQARDAWQQAEGAGPLQPWWVEHDSFDRSQDAAAIGALVDWILLGRASGLVYPSASSFGHEAAVAMGDRGPSLGLSAPRITQRARQASTFAGNGWRRLRRTVSRQAT